jgi:hypothetical protein
MIEDSKIENGIEGKFQMRFRPSMIFDNTDSKATTRRI